MRFIVTGVPRSGTKYAARLLSECGADCMHEEPLRPLAPVIDCLRWYCDGKTGVSSWMAWALLSLFPEPVPVLRTIRDPWMVIDSLACRNSIMKVEQFAPREMRAVREMIRSYTPRVWEYSSRVDRAAAFVVDWNKIIEERVPPEWMYTYQVDKMTALTLKTMLQHIGANVEPAKAEKAFADVSTATNSGYTIIETTGVSDENVANYLNEYCKQEGIRQVWTRRIKNTPDRLSKDQVAERMDPSLLVEVNEHAERWGYSTAKQLTAVA